MYIPKVNLYINVQCLRLNHCVMLPYCLNFHLKILYIVPHAAIYSKNVVLRSTNKKVAGFQLNLEVSLLTYDHEWTS